MRQDALLTELVDSILTHRHLERYPHVYYLRDRMVAKGYVRIEDALQNYEWGRSLIDAGIKVPRSYAVIEPEKIKPMTKGWSLNEKKFEYWYFIMQKIEGEATGTLRGEERDRAEELLAGEIRKVLKLDIIPDDCFYGGNSIYNRKEDQTYLIDFGFWERCSPDSEDKESILKKLSVPGWLVDDIPREKISCDHQI